MDHIIDWDDAYSNRAYIPGADAIAEDWPVRSKAFRDLLAQADRLRADIAYGPHARNRLDLFLPEGRPKGLVVFVHGGYWMLFDKESFSFTAAGPVAAGYAVAMPSYVLCPEARIGDITRQIGKAVTHAASLIEGPLHLFGHSAGGHLVSRMVSSTSPLPPGVLGRIRKTVSISGVHDLRPLMKTSMNQILRIDEAEAGRESPALLHPAGGTEITFWVGADERPEFLRQTAFMKDAWGAAAKVKTVVEPQRHHFDVIDGLTDADHPLVRALLVL
jgi:acetyl esterase/lipase